MATAEYNCPSCSAPLQIENRFSKVVICAYCGQTCNVTPDGLDPSGQKTDLADFESILAIGKTGTIKGEKFKVHGRLRYKYDEGFWDEWFVTLESGKKLWLQEDEGEFTAFEKETLTSPLPAFEEIRVGSMVSVNDKSAFVTEKSTAFIAGGVGELFFKIVPGMEVKCFDGNAGGQLLSVEFTPDEINLSVGHELSRADITVDA